MKKNKLKLLPVLDPGELSLDAGEKVTSSWSELAHQGLLAVSDLAPDPVWGGIDNTAATAGSGPNPG